MPMESPQKTWKPNKCVFAARLKVALTGLLKIKATVAVAMAAVWDVAVVMRVAGHLPEYSPSTYTHTFNIMLS